MGGSGQLRPDAASHSRYRSIDLLRGAAVVMMVFVHFVENLSPPDGPGLTLRYVVSRWIGGRAGAIFTILSGVTYYLWLRKQESLGRRATEITKTSVRRGAFLFGVGIGFNALIWLPDETFNWDVLTLIGASQVVLAFARHLPRSVIASLCCIVLLLSPLLRVASCYPEYWEGETYVYDACLSDVVLGFFANGFFPLFPWLAFPLAGYLLAGTLWPAVARKPRTAHVLAVSLGLFLASWLCIAFRMQLAGGLLRPYAEGFGMFPATTAYVLASFGMVAILVVVLHAWIDQRAAAAPGGRLTTWLQTFGTFSLTVYILHHVVHLWPLWCVATWEGREAKHYWQNASSPGTAIGLALLFLILCSALLAVLRRNYGRGIESFMRWMCE